MVECLRLLSADDCKDDCLSGMTATRMTSVFEGVAAEETLRDLDASEP